MLSLERLREIDPRLAKIPDDNLTKIRDQLYALGQLAIETWLEENGGSKYPTGDNEDSLDL